MNLTKKAASNDFPCWGTVARIARSWEASFPTALWPVIPQEEIEDHKIFSDSFFRLKDGTKSSVCAFS
jgi:hypothetical protein